MPAENPNERDESALERETVYALTNPDRPAILSLENIGQMLETDDPGAVVTPLVRAGLVHRSSEDYVFASPAAFKWVQLVGHVV
jgi:hypothetical protein